MKLKMHGPAIEWTKENRQHAETRLRFALSRFGQHIGLVTVRILALNGTRTAISKTCRIVVNLLPMGRITVEQTQPDLLSALDYAADRAGRAVQRELDRVKGSGPGFPNSPS